MRHTDKLTLEEIRNQAAEKLESHVSRLSLYSWPIQFASTAGPRKGRIAGQAITTFQVYAFVDEMTDKKIMYCGEVWKEWDGTPNCLWE